MAAKKKVAMVEQLPDGRFQTTADGIIRKTRILDKHKLFVEKELMKKYGENIEVEWIEKTTEAIDKSVEELEEEMAAPEYDIDTRFIFLEQAVEMVADKVAKAAVITGEGGVGKTYTVLKTLEEKGMINTTGEQQADDEYVKNDKSSIC